MPFTIKLCLSLVVLAVAVAAFFFEASLGQTGPKYAIVFLAPFMVAAMWVFPEIKPSQRQR